MAAMAPRISRPLGLDSIGSLTSLVKAREERWRRLRPTKQLDTCRLRGTMKFTRSSPNLKLASLSSPISTLRPYCRSNIHYPPLHQSLKLLLTPTSSTLILSLFSALLANISPAVADFISRPLHIRSDVVSQATHLT